MLLKLDLLIQKFGLKITGVIQAGAHWGEEFETFKKCGITRGHFFEPCSDAFGILGKKIPIGGYYCYMCALGDHSGEERINIESSNQGQSNSLLKPVKHLEYYPNIVFDSCETVSVRPLDYFRIIDCNFLVMDTQGTELSILKGAEETLKHIDYIYTEVNREELYENCAMAEDLDNYLTEFKRVQTVWKRKGFGDALYIKKILL